MGNSYSLFGKTSKYNTCAFSVSFEYNCVDSLGGFIDRNKDWILHEYFHLVQASSTIFGLWNFILYVNHFLEVSEASRRTIDITKFTRPFFSWNKMKDGKKFQDLEMLLFEKKKLPFAQNIQFVKFNKTKLPSIDIDGIKHPFPGICAEFNNNGTTLLYELTPISFYEAYSKCVEDETLKQTFSIPFGRDCFYYYAVRIILNQLFPNISHAQSVVILHWSLNSDSPGEFFKEIIDYLLNVYHTNLPPEKQLSDDIKNNVYWLKNNLHTIYLKKLYDLYVYQLGCKDRLLAGILLNVYNFFVANFSYITSNQSIPCLSMYPFILTKGHSLPHINQCMTHNCTIIPLPLYFRQENGFAYTLSNTQFPNYSSVTSLLCVFEMVKRGLLIYGCPIFNDCNLSCKDCSCSKFLYKKKATCEIMMILRYFM